MFPGRRFLRTRKRTPPAGTQQDRAPKRYAYQQRRTDKRMSGRIPELKTVLYSVSAIFPILSPFRQFPLPYTADPVFLYSCQSFSPRYASVSPPRSAVTIPSVPAAGFSLPLCASGRTVSPAERKEKAPAGAFLRSGKSGIRTRGAFPPARFQGVCIKPLCHLSVLCSGGCRKV